MERSSNAQATNPGGVEISRLVAFGAQHGQRDVFHGKRRWARYHLGTRLEISTNQEQPTPAFSAVMHNISAGGVGFWCKQEVVPQAHVLIREWSAAGSKPWARARVTHATLAINGYLVGAEFEQAVAPPEANDSPARFEEESLPPAARYSLVRYCACYTGAAALFGGAVTVSVLESAGLTRGMLPYAILVAASAAVAAWVGAGLSLQSPLRFLRDLREAVVRTPTETAKPLKLSDPPGRELSSLVTALAELRAGWRSREEHERTQRQKLEEINLTKSNILNMVSHDLRTPLTSIRLYAEMLAEQLNELEDADRKRFLDIITEECKRLSRLVDDLLEAQRLEASRVRWDMRPTDLSQIIRDCGVIFEPMAAGKSISLKVDCPEDLATVEADADKISQVLSNLISNALKYTPNGGSVQVSARAQTSDVVICVADDGPGIPRDKWDQIFDRFSQLSVNFVREISGVGLGLYIVRQIVNRHGGRVWVESELDKGSTFYVALPIKTAEPAVEQPEPQPRAGRVLVCDADPELAGRITQLLRQAGYDVRVAHSGCRLLAHIVESQPDAVITDLLLPDMNSSDLLASMADLRRRHRFKLAVHTYLSDGPDLRRRGADVVIERPARTEELLQAVHVMLRTKSSDGLAVLLASPPGVDTQALRSALLEAGHVPISARSSHEAAHLLRGFPVDVVVAWEEFVADSEFNLIGLLNDDPRTRAMVIVQRLPRRERKALQGAGAVLIEGPLSGRALVREIAGRLPAAVET